MVISAVQTQNIFGIQAGNASKMLPDTLLPGRIDNSESIFTSVDTEISLENEKNIDIIAHRGYSVDAPENTIAAFIAAAENGYNTIECDIEWSKDSVPVLLHDSTINRTARKQNGDKLLFPKKCSSLTYNELLEYDFGSWCGSEYSGTKIPTFYELMDCAKEYDLRLYIELKETKNFDINKAQILVDAVRETGLENNVTWISFEEDYLKMISDLAPGARLGYLNDKKVTNKTVKTLENLKTDDNEVFLDIKSSKISEKASEMLDNAGFNFEVWGIEDTNKLDVLFSYDCKGITTDTITNSTLEEYLNLAE